MMRYTLFLAILYFLTISNAYSYSLKIKNIIITDKKILSLKDICEIEKSYRSFESIKDIHILDIEGYPKHKRISGSAIKDILKQKISTSVVDEIYIPDYIDIYRGKRILNKIYLSNILKKYVAHNTPYLVGDKVVRDISTPEYIILNSDEKVTIKPIGEKIKPGHNSVSFIIEKNNKQIASRPAKFFLDVYTTIPCAARPLNRGEVLTPEKVSFEKKNLAYLPEDIWDGKSGPWRIKIPIGTHEPITLQRLEPVPAVTKGQKVNLIYSGRNIFLRTLALAVEDGKIGDIIKVLNLQSKRYVFGKIINNETVEVR